MRRIGLRLISGCVSIGLLASLLHDIVVGAFSMHGELVRRETHPVGFWLWAAFVAAVSFAVLYGAVFEFREDEKR